MIVNVRHAAIVVHDLIFMRDFYKSVFGFEVAKEEIETGPFIETVVGLSKVNLHWVKMRMPNNLLLELLKYISPESPQRTQEITSNAFGHSHLAFTVSNIELFLKTLVLHGGRVVNQPAKNPAGTVWVCYAKDPEGNILEIVQET